MPWALGRSSRIKPLGFAARFVGTCRTCRGSAVEWTNWVFPPTIPSIAVSARPKTRSRNCTFVFTMLPALQALRPGEGDGHVLALPFRTTFVCLRRMNPKQRAAAAALAFIESGMVVGLGTGSTSECFLQALASVLKRGVLRDVRGVPTSLQSERRARELGIPLVTFSQCPRPDITIDGCDEVDDRLDLIKGLGGALLREKIVAQNSRRLIIIADASKRVSRLGTRCPLPVEVAVFAYETHREFFVTLGASPSLRHTPEGSIFITDNGNYIYDLRFDQIDNPSGLDATLRARAGVVGSGLFLGMAERALIADESEVRELSR